MQSGLLEPQGGEVPDGEKGLQRSADEVEDSKSEALRFEGCFHTHLVVSYFLSLTLLVVFTPLSGCFSRYVLLLITLFFVPGVMMIVAYGLISRELYRGIQFELGQNKDDKAGEIHQKYNRACENVYIQIFLLHSKTVQCFKVIALSNRHMFR